MRRICLKRSESIQDRLGMGNNCKKRWLLVPNKLHQITRNRHKQAGSTHLGTNIPALPQNRREIANTNTGSSLASATQSSSLQLALQSVQRNYVLPTRVMQNLRWCRIYGMEYYLIVHTGNFFFFLTDYCYSLKNSTLSFSYYYSLYNL